MGAGVDRAVLVGSDVGAVVVGDPAEDVVGAVDVGGAEVAAEDVVGAEDDAVDGVPSPRVRSQAVTPAAISTTANTAAATTHICRRPT
ncbi:MAG: hypothetical protein ACXVYC_15125, partial [Blastococcus sp.]